MDGTAQCIKMSRLEFVHTVDISLFISDFFFLKLNSCTRVAVAREAACQSNLERGAEPQIAPGERVGPLHGSLCHQCMHVCANG